MYALGRLDWVRRVSSAAVRRRASSMQELFRQEMDLGVISSPLLDDLPLSDKGDNVLSSFARARSLRKCRTSGVLAEVNILEFEVRSGVFGVLKPNRSAALASSDLYT